MATRKLKSSWTKSDPSVVLALVCTGIYYSIIFQPAVHESWVAKYTTEHAVEYVIVMLFFWGLCDILVKLLRLPREQRAMNHDWMQNVSESLTADSARECLKQFQESQPSLLSTRMGRRISDVLKYVSIKGSGAELDKHFEHLSVQDDEELHEDYSVLRFVIAVTPILGFLGTVVHFGTSIGSFSFEDMEAKLPIIVSGMGTAFNTTSVALATSMTVMFAMFLCERIERRNILHVNRWIERELQYRLIGTTASVEPFLGLIQATNDQTMDALRLSFDDLSQNWNRQLLALMQSFQEQRREELTHFAAGIKQISQQHEAHEVAREDLLQTLMTQISAEQDQHWQRFQTSLDRAALFRDDVRELLSTLNAIGQGEGRLVELQVALADNLRVLHETSQLDSAVNGLTGAIHLLTSRSRPFGHSDSAAA